MEILINKESETNPKYGIDPNKRIVEELLNYGLIVLNKPQGPTSHQVMDFIKNILNIDKVGHSGTLDPNVTGVLVVALGKVTRSIDVLLKSGKEYVCYMKMHDDVEESKIKEVLNSFVGEIMQLPPLKSAVKRQLRKREIYYIDILEIDGRDVLYKVGCQAGTYIRKLCTDAGEKMGTKAHMQELIRTKVAHFTDKEWVSLYDLKDAYVAWKEEGDEGPIRKIILPIERIVENIPNVWVLDSAVDAICHGAFLSVPGVAKLSDNINVGDKIGVMTLKGELIGIGIAKMNSMNIMRQDKGYAITDIKVFMERGVYPKYEKKS